MQQERTRPVQARMEDHLGPLRLRRNIDEINTPSCARIAERPAGVMLLRPDLVACR